MRYVLSQGAVETAQSLGSGDGAIRVVGNPIRFGGHAGFLPRGPGHRERGQSLGAKPARLDVLKRVGGGIPGLTGRPGKRSQRTGEHKGIQALAAEHVAQHGRSLNLGTEDTQQALPIVSRQKDVVADAGAMEHGAYVRVVAAHPFHLREGSNVGSHQVNRRAKRFDFFQGADLGNQPAIRTGRLQAFPRRPLREPGAVDEHQLHARLPGQIPRDFEPHPTGSSGDEIGRSFSNRKGAVGTGGEVQRFDGWNEAHPLAPGDNRIAGGEGRAEFAQDQFTRTGGIEVQETAAEAGRLLLRHAAETGRGGVNRIERRLLAGDLMSQASHRQQVRLSAPSGQRFR